MDGMAPQKKVAFSYFNKGISLRTEKYRFTKYDRQELPNIELYDHSSDPDESVNIAAERSKVVEELSAMIEEMTSEIQE